MDVNKYLSRSYFDVKRSKHQATDIIASGENSLLLKTDEGKILKICSSDKDYGVYSERLDWLQELGLRGTLNKYISMPLAKLNGLKHGEYGYVCEDADGVNLDYYIHPSKDIKPFNKWYYDSTGGIEYRLKLAYTIALALEQIHQCGYCFVDICPSNVVVTQFDSNERTPLKAKFLGAENIASYTFNPHINGSDMYVDPMVYSNRNGNSTVSDTYSYAIMIFQLLTTCHPFVGDECEVREQEEIINMIHSGELDYIGDEDSTKNKNDTFDMTQIFVPRELRELFYKMFVVGKFNPNGRPTLTDFKNACRRATQKLIMCTNSSCKRQYPYNVNKVCPFCHEPSKNVVVVRLKRVLTSSEKILLPYDENKGFSSLPPIEENINYMILKPGLNRLPTSFFDSSFPDEEGFAGILIQCNNKEIKIRNSFKKARIKVNGTILEPFSKNNIEKSDIVVALSKEIIIEFPKNLMVHSESAANLSCEQYGEVISKWAITIG